MTTDTTPGVDHAAAIRYHLYAFDLVRPADPDAFSEAAISHVEDIRDHLDALDAARRDAEARCARLRRYGLGWEDDFREQFVTKELNDPHLQGFVEATIQQMRNEHLHPGDLAEPAPARADGGA